MTKLASLKNEGSDRKKVELWLDHINETDESCRKEVLDQCAKDKEARIYYVDRYREDCEK